jgi:Predicted membrane protein (DUF2231)
VGSSQPDLITIGGLPAHPILVHAVVVLLPLAALGGLIIALRARWRRRFGPAVLLLTAVGVAAVPLATTTGNQLKAVLPPNAAINRHADLGNNLLPFALAFGVAVLLLIIAGRLADRARDAALASTGPGTATATASTGAAASGHDHTDRHGNQDRDGKVPAARTWRRVAIAAAALVAFTGVATTAQVVRVGHTGAAAVWEGVGGP